jgi:AcrR family transcriptional regulator
MTSDKSNHYHHGDVPCALMAAALVRIKRDGVEKLSLRALARDIGVSQTAPYRHFKDKTCLLVELARSGFAKLTQYKLACCGDEVNLENMVVFAMSYVYFAKEFPEQYKLMFGSKIEKRCEHPDLMASSHEAFTVILDQVTRGIERGFLIDEDPIYLAKFCWAHVHGLASLLIDGFFDDLPMDFDDFLRQQITYNIRGIAKDPNSIL